MSGIEFEERDGPRLEGMLRYVEEDYSFSFTPYSSEDLGTRAPAGRSSLLIGNLQLEVSLPDQYILFPWGLLPRTIWEAGSLRPPVVTPGLVSVVSPKGIESGVSEEINGRFDWTATWDRRSGWLRLSRNAQQEESATEVCTGMALAIRRRCLVAVWLRADDLIDSRTWDPSNG